MHHALWAYHALMNLMIEILWCGVKFPVNGHTSNEANIHTLGVQEKGSSTFI